MRRFVCLFLLLAVCRMSRRTVIPISGRKYAGVMGPAGADWLVRPEREAEEKPDLALKLIGVPKGATVGDIGAGAGYLTWRLAALVGPTGKVYANDIQPEMLDLLRRNMRAAQDHQRRNRPRRVRRSQTAARTRWTW